MFHSIRFSVFLVVSLAAVARADVRLHALFTDHGVLQQGKRLPVWGWAENGERVTVEFAGQKAVTVAQSGRWLVWLAPLKASAESRVMRVTGRNTLEVQDLLVGEVWLASGQSNMEMPLKISLNSEADIQAATQPNLRLFTVPKLKAQAPVQNVKSTWSLCSPDAAQGFTAVGYYFGRDLQAALGVPVGIIHTSWGGSPAEVWLSANNLKADPEFCRDIFDAYPATYRNWQRAKRDWEAAKLDAQQKGVAFTQPQPGLGWKPSELYNGMIAPLLPYGVAGAIWYQGESNASRAWQYRRLFPAMIQNWRSDFGQGDFPFLAVQLAPWDRNKKRTLPEITAAPGDSDWAELREAQNYSAQVLKKVGIAVITDVGDKDDIHPAQKQPVGARLALLARTMAYGDKKVVSSGPVYRKLSVNGNKALLTFDQVGHGLTPKGEVVTGFSVAGEDRKFHWGDARIEDGNRVSVVSSDVAKPVAVRFGWADYPVVNLRNDAGLPASPFRTDNWPLTTQGRK